MKTVALGPVRFWKYRAVWAGLYLARLTLTLTITLPFFVMVDADLAGSVFARPLLKAWSADVIVELLSTRDNLLSSFLVVLFAYSFLVFLFKQFLNGGIYYCYLSGRNVGLHDFFAESGRRFGNHLRISILLGVVYLPLAVIASVAMVLVPADLFGHFSDGFARGLSFRFILGGLIVILGVILSDLLRLRLTAFPEERLTATLSSAFGFYRRHFVKLYGIYLVYFVPYVIAWVILAKLAGAVTESSGGLLGVIVEVALFQLCILLQSGQSLLFTASVAPVFGSAQPGRFRDIVQGELGFD
jgi:hypothetical protein